MKGLFEPIRQTAWYQKALTDLREKKPFLIYGAGESVQDHLAASFSYATGRPLLIVAANEVKAKEIFSEMKFYDSDGTYYIASKDLLFSSADSQGLAVADNRAKGLRAIYEKTARTVVLSVDCLFERLAPGKVWQQSVLTISQDTELDEDDLFQRLADMGYERVEQVESPGQAAIRGGIVDIYPIGDDTAVRIELWGDEIDHMSRMDPDTQRSIGDAVDKVMIYPVTEIPIKEDVRRTGIDKIRKGLEEGLKKLQKEGMTEEADHLRQMTERTIEKLETNRPVDLDNYVTLFYPDSGTILDYIDPDSIVVLTEPVRIKERMESLTDQLSLSVAERLKKGYLFAEQQDMFPTKAEIQKGLTSFARASLCGILGSGDDYFPVQDIIAIQSQSINVLDGSGSALLDELKGNRRANMRTVILMDSTTKAQRLSEMLKEDGLDASFRGSLDEEIRPGQIVTARGALLHGFSYPDAGLAVLSMDELTEKGRRVSKRRKKFTGGQVLKSYDDIKVGDYVVHENHGVGIYNGIVQMSDGDTKRDYFKITYKDNGILYVPTTSLDMLQKYVAGEGASPKLNDLNGKDWERTKAKVRAGVAKLAEDLVKLYAERQSRPGYAFSKDTVFQREFEESFPYEETEDQLKAIEETKRDMESPHIMDRLICGDVGYGKTEVALRAAFKAVQDSKQVALMAPTTILAQQHYNTFTRRMKDMPVNIGILSRFNTPKQTKDVLTRLSSGELDIVIGTHSLLGKNVRFKDLGLLIIDEEQRFGVGHKEKIKALKKDVDVLTLTATPIPRTLHMSLTGMRDMSLLNEAPMDRHPVQTYVMEQDDQMIREAIYRELARSGQVFYLHNRVNSIAACAARIQQLVPEARVVMAHGQMPERELENIMMQFVEGNADVLVCTTIIETGLDIPNANTIIVENADTMGLAQLYQLRGRVGRSTRMAYAYFLYQQGKVLTEDAQNRLEALGELTGFGSGYKIALQDLKIRGAGNVLGPEQHGHMGAVGYEMYTKMLQEAISKAGGASPSSASAPDAMPEFETTIHIAADAYLPSSYIPSEKQKMETYKKIADIKNEEQYSDMLDEMVDRFGDPPRQVTNLLTISLIKAIVQSFGTDQLDYYHDQNTAYLSLRLRDDAPIDLEKLRIFLGQKKGAAHLKTDKGHQTLVVRLEKSSKERIMLQHILDAVKEIAKLKRGGAA